MSTARSTLHAAVGSLPRPSSSIRRSALAGGLAIGLMVLVTSPGGAEPQSGPEQPTASALSLPVIRTARAAPLGADLDLAREDETTAIAVLADAGTTLDEASDARATALIWADTAQDELMRARVRLGDLIAAEEAAVVDLRGAVAGVERERRGSKAHRSAFIRWQMAAVAERAAHTRRTIAAQTGTTRFEQLEAAEAELTDAELALGRAASAHRTAERVAASASARLAQVEAEALAAVDSPATPSMSPAHASPEPPASPHDAERGRP